jgi:2-dehydro-3-deoxygluconokinase
VEVAVQKAALVLGPDGHRLPVAADGEPLRAGVLPLTALALCPQAGAQNGRFWDVAADLDRGGCTMSSAAQGPGGPVRVGGACDAVDLLAIGETLVQLAPLPGSTVAMGSCLQLAPGGAESNVAMSCARLGHRSVWASRVGADHLSRALVAEIGASGVETRVEVDTDRLSAVYVKVPRPNCSTTILYYRNGSAASTMSPAFLNGLADLHPRIVHVSGITPALSAQCFALTETLLRERPFGQALVSFDINHRPSLWRVDAARVLRDFAGLADVVFVGLDEAERLWGVERADQVRALLPDVPFLVVKDGAHEAVQFGPEGTTRVPALPVEVLEPVGAGDAFAAGWLAGALRDLPARQRLLLGHHIAAAVLRSHTDQAPMPSPAEIDDLLTARTEPAS